MNGDLCALAPELWLLLNRNSVLCACCCDSVNLCSSFFNYSGNAVCLFCIFHSSQRWAERQRQQKLREQEQDFNFLADIPAVEKEDIVEERDSLDSSRATTPPGPDFPTSKSMPNPRNTFPFSKSMPNPPSALRHHHSPFDPSGAAARLANGPSLTTSFSGGIESSMLPKVGDTRKRLAHFAVGSVIHRYSPRGSMEGTTSFAPASCVSLPGKHVGACMNGRARHAGAQIACAVDQKVLL